MKLRLGVSVSPFLAGERRSCVCKAISIEPSSSCQAKNNRFLLQGSKSLQRWLHSSSSEEDDFSELGPAVTQGVGTLLKLSTEKREIFMKKDPARKAAARKSLRVEINPSVKDLLLNMDKASRDAPKLENPNNISRITGNSRSDSKLKNSSSISIENVPSVVSLSQLIEAVSSFGKISCASMRNVPNGLDCCDVKFENEESTWRAILVGGITVKSFHLPIRAHCFPKSVNIRITDISKDTAYTAIQSVCKTIGTLEGMARTREDTVDVFFSLKDYSEAQNILKELNDTIVDSCQWSAHFLPKPSVPAPMSKNDYRELSFQVSSCLSELKREFSMRRIYSEDLEYMQLAIMHLEEQPSINNASEMD